MTRSLCGANSVGSPESVFRPCGRSIFSDLPLARSTRYPSVNPSAFTTVTEAFAVRGKGPGERLPFQICDPGQLLAGDVEQGHVHVSTLAIAAQENRAA